MAITLVGSPLSGTAIDANSVTLTFSTDIQQNDVVVISGGLSQIGPWGIGSIATTGYELILESTKNKRAIAAYKIMGATPDTNVVSATGTDARDANAWAGYVLRGVSTQVLDSTATIQYSSGSASNVDPPSAVVNTSGAWVIAVGNGLINDANVGTISGYTNDVSTNANDTFDATVALATREISSAGTEDPGAWSTFSVSQWSAFTFVIQPSASTSTGATTTTKPTPTFLTLGIGV